MFSPTTVHALADWHEAPYSALNLAPGGPAAGVDRNQPEPL